MGKYILFSFKFILYLDPSLTPARIPVLYSEPPKTKLDRFQLRCYFIIEIYVKRKNYLMIF